MLVHNPGDEHWVVLDFEGVGAVDATAIDTLGTLVDDFRARGIVLAVARANERALAPLRRAGLLDDGGLRIYATIRLAVRAFEATRPGA
jgi:SulP family sulfate permease